MSEVSLRSIAQAAGVSASLVSRILRNNMGNVSASDQVRQRVLRIADEMGYSPDQRARRLRTGQNETIAVVLPIGRNFATSLGPEEFRGIMEQTKKYDYDFIFRYFSNSDEETATLKDVVGMHIDGLLFAPSAYFPFTEEKRQLFHRLQKRGVKIMFIGERYPIPDTCFVNIDDVAGTIAALEMLLEDGARKIAYFYCLMERRLEAVRTMCAERGVALQVYECSDFTMEAAEAAARHCLAQECPSHVLAICDITAIGVRKVFRQNGINPMIVGFDGLKLCSLLDDSFPTVCQPVYESGQLAVRNLMAWIMGEEIESITLKTVVKRTNEKKGRSQQ